MIYSRPVQHFTQSQDPEQQKKVSILSFYSIPVSCFLSARSEVLLFSQFSPVLWLVHDVGSDLTYWAFSLPSPNFRIAFPTSIMPSRRSPRPCVTAATLGESHPQSTRDALVQVPVLHWAASECCVQSWFQIVSPSAFCLPFYLRQIFSIDKEHRKKTHGVYKIRSATLTGSCQYKSSSTWNQG